MTQATAVLGRLDAAGFALIGLIAVVTWLRHRGRTRACLAVALGLLGLVSAMRQLVPLANPPAAFSLVTLIAFMGSGYGLVELRHSLLPLSNRSRRLLQAVLGVTTVLSVPVVVFAPPTAKPTVYGWVIGCALILEWCGCIAEPALRFRLAARGKPVVQARRLRALANGYLGIAVALVLALGVAVVQAAASSSPNPAVGLGFQLVATAAIPLFYIGFAPPAWLRRSWRAKEGEAFRRAHDALVTYADDPEAMAARALDWAMRFTGASAGVMLDTDGRVLARDGDAGTDLSRLVARARRECGDEPRLASGDVALVPVWTRTGRAVLAVEAGGFSPHFGHDEVGVLAGFAHSIGLALDRVHLSDELRTQTERMQSLLGAVSELGAGLVITDNGRLAYANDAYLAMTGFTLDELQGRNLIDLAPEEDRAEITDRLRSRMAGGDVPLRYEARLVRKDQRHVEVEAVVHRLSDDPGTRLIALVQDISARKRAERTLEETARLDPLTGVANRRAWQERLAEALSYAARHEEPISVALLDLDGFKEFNDDWGHQRGDQLLIDIAQGWKGALRAEDFLARYGGDEFSVIMPGSTAEQAVLALQRLTDATPERASAGVAQWDGVETGDELLARADGALMRSKKERRGAVSVASSHRHDRAAGWTSRLDRVLEQRYLRSAYQPIKQLDTGEVLGYEALLRLAGSSADSSVEDLFTAAQRLGYSRDLDWVSRRAALECSRNLPEESLLFVNVSARALLDPVHASDQMLMLLRWADRDASTVVLEISEREMINNLTRLRTVLAEYRDHGFRFALDDVGEGHSTLEVLAAAEAEYIKIARRLTENVQEAGPGAAVRAIVTFAESSGATTIAEGISRLSMVDLMLDLGVRCGQGFALGLPEFVAPPMLARAALKAG